MNQYFRGWVCWLMMISMSVLFSRCANIVPPGGGPRDTIPPVLLASTPPDSTLHFNSKKIRFVFDEYVELESVTDKLIVSPTLKRTPLVTAKLHTVTLEIRDTLQPNTTYTFNFADAIRDINERNIMQDFQYVVSTGDYLDSLQVLGRIVNAETGALDSNVAVMLYRGTEDSIVAKEKPVYYAKTKADGTYRFKNLAPGSYKIFALKEEDRDMQYNQPAEMIAFQEAPLVLKETNLHDINLLLFMENDSTIKKTFPEDEPEEEPEPVKEKEKDKDKKKLPRLQMTAATEGGQQELPAPLTLQFTMPVKTLDSVRLLLQEDTLHTPVAYTATFDSTRTKYIVQHQWKEGTPYRVILPKDAVQDTAGQHLLKADTLTFTTKKQNDYGKVRIKFKLSDSTRTALNDSTMRFMIQLVQDKNIKYTADITNGLWSQDLITPGEYEVRILMDRNGNGKWDRGVYFGSPKRQPEKVVAFPEKLNLKANWSLGPTYEL